MMTMSIMIKEKYGIKLTKEEEAYKKKPTTNGRPPDRTITKSIQKTTLTPDDNLFLLSLLKECKEAGHRPTPNELINALVEAGRL